MVNFIYSFLLFSQEVLEAFRPLVSFIVNWSFLCRGFKDYMPFLLFITQPTYYCIGARYLGKIEPLIVWQRQIPGQGLAVQNELHPKYCSDWFVSGMGFPFTMEQNNSSRADGGSLNFETLWYKSNLWFKPSELFIFIYTAGNVKNFLVPSRPHKHRFVNPYIQFMALNCAHYCNLYSEQIDYWSPRKLVTKCDWLSITQIASNISSEYNF